jgi:hypothetical protein
LIRPILAVTAAMLVFASPASALTVKWTPVTNAAVFEIGADAAMLCAIDGAAPSPCTSPWRPDIAGDGVHKFVVSSGIFSQTGSFTLDRTGPAIAFTAGPEQAALTVTYALTVSEGTPECTWDGATVACGAALDGVADGEHVLVVRAADALGNVTEVTRRLTVAQPQVTHIDVAPGPPASQGGVLSSSAGRPSARLTSTRTRGWTLLKTLKILDVPAGTAIKATCKGKGAGCPKRALRVTAARDGDVSLKGLTGRRLRPGTVIAIALSRRGAPAQTIRITIRSLAAPRIG